MKSRSEKFIQQRKFLMVLPLLVTPFITMIFWALGGGKGGTVQSAVASDHLNVSLPDAHFGKREVWDKLSLYEIAERDSARFKEARESDPYFDLITFGSSEQDTTRRKQDNLITAFPHKDKTIADENEEKVNRKLEELYREINKTEAPKENKKNDPVPRASNDPQFSQDVDRLEAMMNGINEPGEPAQEMQQIESVLEKLLDVQHPERVKERLRAMEAARSENAYAVDRVSEGDNISLMRSHSALMDMDTATFLQTIMEGPVSINGFFGLDGQDLVAAEEGNGIEAIIHDTQQLVVGSTVKIRLINSVEINGRRVPKDQFIYGVCSINGERLQISVSSIRSGNSVMPVSLAVFDLDGMEGIYIPGAIARDAAKQASDNAVQNMQLMSVDPSLGAQATVAGVEAAKGIFSKKAKLIKVTVKAGYKLLLRDTSTAAR